MNERAFERLLLAILIILAVLASVPVMRLAGDRPLFPLGDSYHNLRMAQLLHENPGVQEDPLQLMPFEDNGYYFFLNWLLKFLDADTIALFVPISLGICTALLLYALLRNLGLEDEIAGYSVMMLAAIPSFIIIYTTLEKLGLALTLALAALVLLVSSKIWLKALGALLLLLTGLVSLPVFAAIIIIYIFMMRRRLKDAAVLIAIPAFAIVVAIILGALSIGDLGFHPPDIALSVLGSSLGYDLFVILLFLTGLLALWIQDKASRVTSLAILVLFAASLFTTPLVAVMSIVMPAYCVYGALHLYKRKWELDIIKAGTTILIACALVFSALNQISLLAEAEPDNDLRASLLSIKYSEPGMIFTHQMYGSVAQFYAGKRTFLDTRVVDEEKNQDNIGLLNSSRISDAEPLLQKYRIKYILITPSTAEETESEEGGMVFLVRNSDNFLNRYDNAGIEIWEYKP